MFGSGNLLLSERGFPMSKALVEQRYCLGSNARMLAAQSVDRIANKNKVLVNRVIFWTLSNCVADSTSSIHTFFVFSIFLPLILIIQSVVVILSIPHTIFSWNWPINTQCIYADIYIYCICTCMCIRSYCVCLCNLYSCLFFPNCWVLVIFLALILISYVSYN